METRRVMKGRNILVNTGCPFYRRKRAKSVLSRVFVLSKCLDRRWPMIIILSLRHVVRQQKVPNSPENSQKIFFLPFDVPLSREKPVQCQHFRFVITMMLSRDVIVKIITRSWENGLPNCPSKHTNMIDNNITENY